VPGEDGVAVGRLLHADAAAAVQPLREGVREALRHVLDDDDARRVGGQRGQHLAQRLGAAGRRADRDHRRGALQQGPRRHRHRRARGRRRHRRGPRRADAGAGRGLHLGADLLGEGHRPGAHVDGRLGDEVDRAQLQRAERSGAAALGERRHHDDGRRPLPHDGLETGEPVLARHLDVERDDVGREQRELRPGDQAVARDAHHLDPGIAAEDLREELAHQRRVVHHEHAHPAHRSSFALRRA
jgi:hypothetical protein